MSRVMKIEIDDDEEMADLEVEDVHCFYANGVLVHNCAEEMRIAAALSGEPVWVNAINNGVDLHKATASEAFHVTVENVEPKQRKIAKTVNFGCCSLDSFIKTQRGTIRIRDLEPRDKLVSRDGSLQNYHGGVEYANGIRVYLSNGQELEVSDDHPFRLFDSETPYWVLAKDLKEGDQLGLLSNSDYYTDIVFKDVGAGLKSQCFHGDVALDEDFAYLLGLILGDGCVQFTKGVPGALDIVCHSSNADYVESILSRYNTHTGRQNFPNYVLFRFHSRSIAKLVYDLIGRTKQKHVPDCIFQTSASIKRSFLAGFIDADGSCDKQHTLKLMTTSPIIKQGMASLLSDLGVAVTCREEEAKLSGKSCGTCYYLTIKSYIDLPLRVSYKLSSLQSKSWKSKVGFKLNKELYPKNFYSAFDPTLYNYLRGQQKSIPVSWFKDKDLEAKDFIPVQVVKVEPIGNLMVYEIECDSHEYQCQGLLTHNCLYDGNEYTIASRCKMPIEEAKAFYDNYTKALKVLYSWKSQRYQEGRTTGSVRNIFGHERRVYSYYHSNSRNLQAFADRTVVSNSIQGTAAVFMRIILTKLERMIYEPDGKWYGKGIIHIANIHDEVDFLVPKKYAKEFCWDLKTVMESVTPPNWPIKMEASPEIGNNFGEIFEVSIVKNEDGSLHFVPKCETPPEKEPVAVTVANEATSDLNLPDEDTEEMGDFVF